MGAGYCLEAAFVHGSAPDRTDLHVFDTPLLIDRALALDGDPHLPDDVSLAWAEPSDYAVPGSGDTDEQEYWPSSAVLLGLRWLHELATAGDSRLIRPAERGTWRQTAFVGELARAISFAEHAEQNDWGLRCIVVP